MFVGYFHRGLPTGYCWLAKEGQGWLFGEVDERGRFSGDNIAYIYPDLLTAITGTFEKEVIKDSYRYGRNTPTLIFENLKPVEKSKNHLNII